MKNTSTRKDSSPTSASSEEKSNRPVRTIWVDDVGASIWSRELVVQGQPRLYYSVSLERSYKDRDGARKYTRTFDAASLSRVIAACTQAGDAIAGMAANPSDGQ